MPDDLTRPDDADVRMTRDELIAHAGRLALESVVNRWGGPFGAVIARDGLIVATGQNRVLLTGDPTAHAEIEAIRKAVQAVNPYAPTIAPDHLDESTLALAAVDGDPSSPPRARMLSGMEIYTSGEPCPMCLAAIHWARLDACYFGCDVDMARQIGFDDAVLYEELGKPRRLRRLKTEQVPSELCEKAYVTWSENRDRHLY